MGRWRGLRDGPRNAKKLNDRSSAPLHSGRTLWHTRRQTPADEWTVERVDEPGKGGLRATYRAGLDSLHFEIPGSDLSRQISTAPLCGNEIEGRLSSTDLPEIGPGPLAKSPFVACNQGLNLLPLNLSDSFGQFRSLPGRRLIFLELSEH